MKNRIYKYCTFFAALGLLTGCASSSSQTDKETELAQFTTPGTDVETMAGEVPFANFTIADGEIKTIDPNEQTSYIPTTEDNPIETVFMTTEAPTEATNPENPKYVVVLDPGHGGILEGAVYDGFYEKNLSLEVGMRCRKYLLENYSDVAVFLTRETDTQLSVDQAEDLESRVAYGASMGANVFVSLHFNADGLYHTTSGAMTFVSKQPWVAEGCRNLSDCILGNLSLLGLNNMGWFEQDSETYFDENGVPLDYYAICRYSASRNLVGIIVEHAFIDNPNDEIYFNTPEALDALAKADAVGIAEYLGLQGK